MSDVVFDLENPTEEHRMLRQMVRNFVRDVVEPQAEEHDRTGTLNVPLLKQAGELGLLGLTIPEQDGGAGLDAVGAVIVHHELSKSDPGFCLAYLAHAVLFVNNFYYASNAAQRERWLSKVISGEWIGAMGMTEPSSGTDVLGMRTTARREGEGFVLKGHKALITNAVDADVFIVYAKVDADVTTFVVERNTPGFSVGKKTEKMGMRASTLSEFMLDDVFVPAENVLGTVGGGVRNMMRNLEIERLTLAAMSLGIADRCLDIMVRYAAERTSFGKSIAEHGQIQRYIGESYAKTEAARALVYSVARDVGPAKRNRIGTDAAKLFAAPVGKEVADNAMQVLGGWGYCNEYKVERFLRDAKLLEIGGGTLESHQKNLTKELLRKVKQD
ncbi:acyl-CoA dehydrogenase family protein [Polyangium jinanense]|uniref:Acyl-CoA dehydrogenase family protein n=1 Tax=Polyangium jinanense TaxID=2829994 RepID=A0A9X4ART2_9BACT|nr:acyl-CoA dehydrogenase family protein [Polyangium jinanense]MDC3952893.1 acyl-CoA dehydrogenase family protein [Polyangium jinanense]MDC3980512.1 acyl-CoA dehydrogenase family protein [Polyangium jinanense]